MDGDLAVHGFASCCQASLFLRAYLPWHGCTACLCLKHAHATCWATVQARGTWLSPFSKPVSKEAGTLHQARDMLQVRLDGNVPSAERAGIIQRFVAPEVPVMLLSVRAGGVGLNLQAADTVIMYDTGRFTLWQTCLVSAGWGPVEMSVPKFMAGLMRPAC